MINPFDTLVGLKGITPDSPAPTVWINDLPGMSTELVSAVADSEDFATGDLAGVAATWTRAKRLGLERLRAMIEGELSKSADYQPMGRKTSTEPAGEPSAIIILPTAERKGYLLKALATGDDEVYLKSLSLDSVNIVDVTTTISVYDATGKQLHTKTVTVKPGYNELVIDFAARSQFGRSLLLFVGIDMGGLSLRTIGTGQDWSCADGYDASFDLDPVSCGLATTPNLGNLSYLTTTGLLLNAYVRRSLHDAITRHVDRLSWGYAHIVGSILMSEKLASPNVNLFTNTNRLFTEEYRDELLKDARSLVMPVSRTMITELRPTKAMRADSEFQQGYYPDGFV